MFHGGNKPSWGRVVALALSRAGYVRVGPSLSSLTGRDMSFQSALKLNDLKSGRFTKAEVLGVDLCFTVHDGKVLCLENSCSHMGLPIDRAEIEADGSFECPWHGFAFKLEGGICKTYPVYKIRTFETKVDGDDVLVDVADVHQDE